MRREQIRPSLKGEDKPGEQPLSIRSCRLPLRVPLYSFAGSGLGSGGFIVAVDLHETARSGVTAYWGCLRFQQPGLALAASRWALWMTGRWLDLKLEYREVTSRCGHRNGRSSVLRPPPGAPKPHHPQRDRCGGRKPWGT